MRRSPRGRGAFAASLVLALGSCKILHTDMAANAFNGGLIDTSDGDPFHSPNDRAIEIVVRRMRDELGDGYFGQGAPDARVCEWMRYVAKNADEWVDKQVLKGDIRGGGTAGTSSCPLTVQQAMQKQIESWEPPGYKAPAISPCDDQGKRRDDVVMQLTDYVRFGTAVVRAASAAAALLDEHIATVDQVKRATRIAFDQTAQYLEDRRWRRNLSHPVAGLVVKGGAATGIFSAGVVWVALSLIDRCKNDMDCSASVDPRELRFSLLSGTSTGAMIVGAVDLYETQEEPADRATAMHKYLDWFACSAIDDLYCLRDRPIFDLARDGDFGALDGLLRFDGIMEKIRDNYGCAEMRNRTELVFNAVDFRTGRLYALSDEDRTALNRPWDVVQAAVASAVLPLFARPVYHMPVDYADAGPNFAYLDGGIRSELPLLPLVRRGAERLLVVSSAASVTGESKPLDNAVQIAARYIDISTGGITEGELEHAQRRAESARLAEIEVCEESVKGVCTPPCRVDKVCTGHWKDVCEAGAKETRTLGEKLEALWDVKSVWRDEQHVEQLHGYSFDPTEQRRLMLAGAEAARQWCLPIAKLLGIEPPPGSAFEKNVHKWCAPSLAPDFCGKPQSGTKPTKEMKACPADEPQPRPRDLERCR
jgi:predicted acylesterase/phospholipase RssA